MRHTTIGSGPFKPVIEFEENIYILDNNTYKNEDKAADHAYRNIQLLRRLVHKQLLEGGYKLKKAETHSK